MSCPTNDPCVDLVAVKAHLETIEADLTKTNTKIRELALEVKVLNSSSERHGQQIDRAQGDLLELRKLVIAVNGSTAQLRAVQDTQTTLLNDTYETGLSTLAMVQSHATEDSLALHKLFRQLFIVGLVLAVVCSLLSAVALVVLSPDHGAFIFDIFKAVQ